MKKLLACGRIFVSVFFCIILATIILVSCLGGENAGFESGWILLGGLVFATVIILLYKLSQKIPWHLPLWGEVVIVGLIMLAVLGLQIFVVKTGGVERTWDAGELSRAVDSIVTDGELQSGWQSDYWSFFPFQYFLFQASVGVVNIIHAVGFDLPTTTILGGLNIILVNLSILLIYLCVRKLLNKRAALLSLLLAVLCSPLILYSTIYYSDTTSMFFVILGFYLLLWVLDKSIKLGLRVLLSGLFGVVMFVAIQIKMTALILLIAAVIYLLLIKNKQVKLKPALTCSAAFLVVFAGLTGIWKISTADAFDEKLALPFTHWVEMGVKDRGGFNVVVTTENLEAITAGEDVATLTKERIGQQLSDYGLGGYLEFLVGKIAYTWGDGSLFVSNKLSREPLHPDSLTTQIVAEGGQYNAIYRVASNIVWCGILLLLLVGGIKTRREWDLSTVIKLALIGVFIFFLFWETRSRYLLNYVPLFIVLATYGLTKLTSGPAADKV